MTKPYHNQRNCWWCWLIMPWNCGNTIHGFCTIIMHLLTLNWFSCIFDQIGHSNDVPATIFVRHGSMWLFSVPEAEENYERRTLYHHWWDQNQIAEGSGSHTEKWVPEVLQRLKKSSGTSVLYLREINLKGTILMLIIK